MKKSIFQSIILLALIMVLACLFYLTPDKKSKNSHPVSPGSVSYIKPGSGIGGGDINGNAVAGKKSLPIYCVKHDDSEKCISISFDAAWGADDTIEILNTLDKYNVKATFFMTGGWVDSYPDMVKEICSRGHDLGNHSHNHKQMSKLSASEQKDEIMYVTDKVKELTGYDVFLFRPPYGDYNSTLINTVYGCNHYPIQWDVDSLDWKDLSAQEILSRVNKSVQNGSILLFHNNSKHILDALPLVLESLKKKGYEVVPVSELIYSEGYTVDDQGIQHKG